MPCLCGDATCTCGIPCHCSDSCNCTDCSISLPRRCRLCCLPFGATEKNMCSCFLQESQISNDKFTCGEFQQNWRNAVTDDSIEVNRMPVCRIQNSNLGVNFNTIVGESQTLPIAYETNALSLNVNFEYKGETFYFSISGNWFNGMFCASLAPPTFYAPPDQILPNDSQPNDSSTYSFQTTRIPMNYSYPQQEYRCGSLDYVEMAGLEMVSDCEFLSQEDQLLENLEEDICTNSVADGRENRNEMSSTDLESNMDTSSISSSDSDVSVTIMADYSSEQMGIQQLKFDIQNSSKSFDATLKETFSSNAGVSSTIYDTDEMTLYAASISASPHQKLEHLDNVSSSVDGIKLDAEEDARLHDSTIKQPTKNLRCDSNDKNSNTVAISTGRSTSQKHEHILNVFAMEFDMKNSAKTKARLTEDSLKDLDRTLNRIQNRRSTSQEHHMESEIGNYDASTDWFLSILEWLQNFTKK